MSKVSNLVTKAMAKPFASKTEAVTNAEFILAGKRTISRDEASKLFAEAGDALAVNFCRLESNMQALISAETQVSDHARQIISETKNLAAQVGDAMARIDKIVVRDFEVKLQQLERFAEAMKTLDELKRTGRLDAITGAFK